MVKYELTDFGTHLRVKKFDASYLNKKVAKYLNSVGYFGDWEISVYEQVWLWLFSPIDNPYFEECPDNEGCFAALIAREADDSE